MAAWDLVSHEMPSSIKKARNKTSMGKSTSLLLVGFLTGILAATVGFSLLLKYKPKSTQGDGALVLKLGHSLPTKHPVHRGIERMKGRLEELSGGTITIDIYPGSVLGSEVECIEQLQNGSLAMTKTSAAALEGFVPEMAVFGFPYLFRDEAHCWSCLLYTSPSPRDKRQSRMPSSA